MKVVGDVNKIHEKTKPARLQKGEVAVYRVLCGTVNPSDESRKVQPMQYPETWPIPNKDRIWDANAENYVDIGVIESIRNVGGVAIPKYRKLTAFPKQTGGFIYCQAGIVEQEENYEFFELTDYNASKEGRDESKPAYFERVLVNEDSKKRNKKRNALLSALKYADNMTNGDVKKFAASQNWNQTLEVDILRDMIGEWIEKDAEGFVKAVEDDSNDIKATLKEAVSKQVISYDPAGNRVAGKTGKTLIKLDPLEGSDWLSQAADWINSHKNGQSVYASIKKLMNNPGETSE